MASAAAPSQWLFLRPRLIRATRPPFHIRPHTHAQPPSFLARTIHKPAHARTRAPTRSPPKQPSSAASKPPPRPPRPQRQPQQTYISAEESYQNSLLARGAETTLFEAPASTSYLLTCRALGTFCLSWAAYNGNEALLIDHPGLWSGIPMMIGGLCIVMAASGAWMIASGTRHVARLVAVPSTTPNGARTLLLRLEGRALTPLPPKRLTVPFAHARLALRPAEARDAGLLGGTARTREGLRAQMLEGRDAAHAGGGGNVLARAFHRLLRTFRRVVGREGILPLYTRAGEDARWRVWRLDVQDGALLEGGAPLERLVRVRDGD